MHHRQRPRLNTERAHLSTYNVGGNFSNPSTSQRSDRERPLPMWLTAATVANSGVRIITAKKIADNELV